MCASSSAFTDSQVLWVCLTWLVVQDRSEEYAKRIMPAEAVQLPTAQDLLAEVLFPEASSQRIPVTRKMYRFLSFSAPQLASRYLLDADDSKLPCYLTILLDQPPGSGTTEMSTSVFIAAQLLGVFNQLKAHSSLKLKFSVFLNSSEVGSSQTMGKLQSRPDTMVSC